MLPVHLFADLPPSASLPPPFSVHTQLPTLFGKASVPDGARTLLFPGSPLIRNAVAASLDSMTLNMNFLSPSPHHLCISETGSCTISKASLGCPEILLLWPCKHWDCRPTSATPGRAWGHLCVSHLFSITFFLSASDSARPPGLLSVLCISRFLGRILFLDVFLCLND